MLSVQDRVKDAILVFIAVAMIAQAAAILLILFRPSIADKIKKFFGM